MRTLVWGNTFIRALKRTIKRNPQYKRIIEGTLRALEEDPFAPKLETHKLKGKLSGSWACTVRCDLRIIFDFVKSLDQKEDDILLLDIGTHREVY
ncbi:MAG: type II toxin-antitoxin system mRNA interferase toxin, RelE/StbE family [Nitrospinae bacterium]|nr:type II toxin-antitoxin system mRNA interferase toxin, RelE/StbE family [Nitrospinota bacterium]